MVLSVVVIIITIQFQILLYKKKINIISPQFMIRYIYNTLNITLIPYIAYTISIATTTSLTRLFYFYIITTTVYSIEVLLTKRKNSQSTEFQVDQEPRIE